MRIKRGKRLLFQFALAGLTLLVIEGVVRFAARAGMVRIRTYPVSTTVSRITFVGNLDPHVGIWHLPGASVRVPTPEGDVIYESNDRGMRDRPRATNSTARERVVVLGDSFVEGTFVAASNRFTDLLEAQTGIEFLNFGTSGGFGSIQEWLLYQHRALDFDHSRVLLFLLPDNDFSDNRPPAPAADRYQPYLQRSNGTYAVAYTTAFHADRERTVHVSRARAWRNRCFNRWLTLNVLVNLDFERMHALTRSAYDEYSDEDLAQLLFSYEQLRAMAAPRPLTIYIIPRDRDFIAREEGRFQSRLPADLTAWAGQRPGVKVVDLMPGFLAHMAEHHVPYQDFFLRFDPHWSPLGHRVAAELVRASQPDLFAAPVAP